jgi:hypothetical protein
MIVGNKGEGCPRFFMAEDDMLAELRSMWDVCIIRLCDVIVLENRSISGGLTVPVWSGAEWAPGPVIPPSVNKIARPLRQHYLTHHNLSW